MSFFEQLLQHYGWEGIALAAVLLVMLAIQLRYWIFLYGAIPNYRTGSRMPRLEKEPPVSVVIAMFAEDYEFVEKRLPLFLAQEHVTFELVLVYVGSDGDFFEDLQRIRQSFPQVVVTKIELNPRFPISPKMALNVGIKSAHYEHVVFSTTDVVPTSDRWLALMARGFTRGEIVLGYCGMTDDREELHGLKGYLIRTSRLMESVDWIAAAVKGHPYRGIRHAMGLTRKRYFSSRNGFGFLNMNIGEDDLFLQTLMTGDNTVVVLSPRATLRERAWGGMRWWIDRLRYFGATRSRYPHRVTSYLNWEMGSRLLFFAAVATALAVMPLEYKAVAALLLLVRYVIVILEVRRIGNRLGENLWSRYLFYDLWSPLQALWVLLLLQRKDPRVWR